MHIALVTKSSPAPIKRQVDTSHQIITAFFEMAINGQKIAVVYDEDGSPGHIVGMGESTLIIKGTAHLHQILTEMRECIRHVAVMADLKSLPSWPKNGGDHNRMATRLMSFDSTHLLVGTCLDDMQLVDRAELQEMMRTTGEGA